MKRSMHPAVPELRHQLETGRISRREFLRYAALLGVSASAATRMAGLGPRPAWSASIRRGGVLRIGMRIQKATDPAQFSWFEPPNVLRNVAEYLTFTDKDNLTHPYLLEKWAASKDLKTWTLSLRKGIRFNNGDPLTADDVVFSMKRWLDKDVGSSMLALMGGYLDSAGIEKVGDHEIRLHLKRPEIAVPEHLFHYPAMILNHRTFEGDFLRIPHGTGPYVLEYYREGEGARLKARHDYWAKGVDGKPLPYLDAMEFVDLGGEASARISAIRSGDVDIIDVATGGAVEAFQALRNHPDVVLKPVTTATVRVLRMRVDQKPWDDNRVRLALKLCQHREKILGLAYMGEGLLGQDFHVYPKHPEYCEKPVPKYDPEQARRLLVEAGYPDGLDVTLSVGSEWSDVVRYAEILKEDAAPAGFRIRIETMPTSQYWEKWSVVNLGITPWAHRPLGTMVLNLAYTSDDEGKPVSWNETRWVDPEFDELLRKANGTLDVEARRKIFCQLEQIQMDRGPIGIAFWRNNWQIHRKRVEGVDAHPIGYLLCRHAWLNA